MSNYKLPKELTAAMWVAKKKMAKRVAEYTQRSREASGTKSSILYNLKNGLPTRANFNGILSRKI